MTWPLSGWIFSSSSSSSMEDDEDTDLTLNNDDDDNDNEYDSFQDDAGINEQNDDHIPTGLTFSVNSPNNTVTIAAVPSTTATADSMAAQRRRTTIWTYEDEIELLRGFLEFTSENRMGIGGGGHRLQQQEAAAFYHKIKPKIHLDCDRNHLIEKLRRLKRKYHMISRNINTGNFRAFKSPNDRSIFSISRKIWSRDTGKTQKSSVFEFVDPNFNNPKVKRGNPRNESKEKKIYDLRQSTKRRRTGFRSGEVSNSDETSTKERSEIEDMSKISGLVEEVAKGCLSPFFKEWMRNGLPPFGFAGKIRSGGGEEAEERWRKQEEMEMEVYMKRLELVVEEIRVSLKEMRSRGKGTQ